MEKIKHLVVGAGLSGAVIAQQIAEKKKEAVVVLERRAHLAGNVFDQPDLATRILVHQYGPHVFHTERKEVWDYLSRFTEWHYFMPFVQAVLDGKLVNIPFNFDSLEKVFPPFLAKLLAQKLLAAYPFGSRITLGDLQKQDDPDLKFLADYVYRKVFLGYTVKQWGLRPEEIDPSVIERVPLLLSRDGRYFQDKYQAIPAQGYTAMVENMLRDPLIEVRLKTDFKDVQKQIDAQNIYFTGSLDEFFDYQLGVLPYRSLRIDLKKYDREFYQTGPQINFPENYDYTRSCEYKYYLDQKSAQTVVSFEYACPFVLHQNERFYPIANEANHQLYQRYVQMAQNYTPSKLYCLGRLGKYQYLNMDQVVAQALAFGQQNF